MNQISGMESLCFFFFVEVVNSILLLLFFALELLSLLYVIKKFRDYLFHLLPILWKKMSLNFTFPQLKNSLIFSISDCLFTVCCALTGYKSKSNSKFYDLSGTVFLSFR